MNLLDITSKLVGGLATGYFTNDAAVKMLFRKYGPVGGVILETREEFVENISNLVERDIISHQALEEELSKEEFKERFADLVDAVMTDYIYQTTGDLKRSEIPAVDGSVANFLSFYQNRGQKFITEILEVLAEKIEIEEIIQQKQLEDLVGLFLDAVFAVLSRTEIFEKLIINFYVENCNNRVDDFISEGIIKKVTDNLDITVDNFHEQLEIHFEEEIDQILEELYSQLEINEVLSQVEKEFKGKTIAEVLDSGSIENIASRLLDRLIQLLESGEGEELIIRFLNDLLELTKGIDMPLLELFDGEIRRNLEDFLADKLPEVVYRGISWLEKNKKIVEELIESTAEEVLEEGSGLRNLVKKIIYQAFKGDLIKNFGIVDEIIKGLENKTDIGQLSKTVTEEIIKYIKTKNLGEIVEYLEESSLIKLDNLVQFLIRNFRKYLTGLDLKSLDRFFAVRIEDIIKIELTDYFKDDIKRLLIEGIKSELLFTPELTGMVKKGLADKVSDFCGQEIEDLIDSQELEIRLEAVEERIMERLIDNRSEIDNKLVNYFAAAVNDKKLADLLDVGELDLNLYNVEKKLEEVKAGKITELYDYLNDRINLEGRGIDLLLELVNNNLAAAAEGRISKIVDGSLSQLSDEELQEAVEELMGSELKPIAFFGALLGMVAALGLYFTQGAVNETLPLQLKFLSSFIVYSLTGYFTNVIALKMVFRPYQEKKLLGVKLPFTPGVVAKNRLHFAEAMGKFVSEELIDSQAVEEFFKENREAIKEKIKENTADNYHLIEEIFRKNSSLIAEEVFNLAVEKVNFEQEELAALIQKEGIKYLDRIKPALREQSKKLIFNLSYPAAEYLMEILHSDKSINEILPDYLIQKFNSHLSLWVKDGLAKSLEVLNDKRKWEQMIRDYSSCSEKMLEYKVGRLISVSEEEIKEVIREYIINKLKSDKVRDGILNLIEREILKELHPKQQLGDLFDGVLMEGLYDNADFIIGTIFAEAVEYLEKSRPKIKSYVLNKVESGFEEEKNSGLGGLIRGKLKELSYNATDADRTIEKIIDKLIDDKFSEFLINKESELKGIINGFLTDVEKSRVEDIGLDLSREGVEKLVDRLLNNDLLVESLAAVLNKGGNLLLQIKLRSFLNLLAIKDTSDFMTAFETELEIIRSSMAENLASNRESIEESLILLVDEIFTELILMVSAQRLTAGIGLEELVGLIDSVLDRLTSSFAFDVGSGELINEVLIELEEMEFQQLLDIQELTNDLTVSWKRLTEDEEFKREILDILTRAVEEIIINLNEIIEEPARDFIFTTAVDSTLDAVEDNILKLMDAVDIKGITEEEVSNMDPAEIEKLFNSFASRYFRQLERYGLIGGGVGLGVELLNYLL